MGKIIAEEVRPLEVNIERTIRTDWDFDESVKLVKANWINFKNITEEMLHHLWVAKTMLVGKRKAGVPKKGEKSWAGYLKEAGINQKTIDSYLRMYCQNGHKKPVSATKDQVEDENIYRVHSYEVVNDKLAIIKFETDNDGVIKTESIKS